MFFKESRKLDVTTLASDRSFMENLINNELNIDDNRIEENLEILSNNSVILDEIDQDLNKFNDINSSQNSISDMPVFDENFIQNNSINNNKNFSVMEGFSYLKNDDIKQFITNFGDGNKDMLKKFMNDPNQFENQIKFKFDIEKKGNAKNQKKMKKEEKLFVFSLDCQVIDF